MLNLSNELSWEDQKLLILMEKGKGEWELSATTSISKKRSTLAKQQGTSKNEVTRFEKMVHEGWKLL